MEKKLIMDELAIQRSLKRITHEIIEKNKGVDNIILVGILTRGIHLANALAELIERFEGVRVPTYELDIRHWRDDHKRMEHSTTDCIPVQERKVILVDDVLFKGRTIRAAMDAITSFGRAKEICRSVPIISARTFQVPCTRRSRSRSRHWITKTLFISAANKAAAAAFFISRTSPSYNGYR